MQNLHSLALSFSSALSVSYELPPSKVIAQQANTLFDEIDFAASQCSRLERQVNGQHFLMNGTEYYFHHQTDLNQLSKLTTRSLLGSYMASIATQDIDSAIIFVERRIKKEKPLMAQIKSEFGSTSGYRQKLKSVHENISHFDSVFVHQGRFFGGHISDDLHSKIGGFLGLPSTKETCFKPNLKVKIPDNHKKARTSSAVSGD